MIKNEGRSPVRRKRSRLALCGVLALALSVTAGLTVGSADAKKKKKKKKKAPVTRVFNETKFVGAGIPDGPPGPGASVPVTVQFNVDSKKFKNRVVGDVNLTFQTLGSIANAAGDLNTFLIAPNGRLGVPTEALFNSVSIGPLTVDDDAGRKICDSATPPCVDPLATLNPPWAGRASAVDTDDDITPMSIFDGVPMPGTWTFGIFDFANTRTSILSQVGLEVTAARPVAP